MPLVITTLLKIYRKYLSFISWRRSNIPKNLFSSQQQHEILQIFQQRRRINKRFPAKWIKMTIPTETWSLYRSFNAFYHRQCKALLSFETLGFFYYRSTWRAAVQRKKIPTQIASWFYRVWKLLYLKIFTKSRINITRWFSRWFEKSHLNFFLFPFC